MPQRMSQTAGEARLFEAARGGDQHAFRELVEPHQGALQAHCYRMLASAGDAEDAMQDTLLRAWRGMGGVRAHATLRAWLYRVATNACLDLAERRPPRVLPRDHGPPTTGEGPGAPLVESIWVEPYPAGPHGPDGDRAGPSARYEARESLELAFIASLQTLPPRQRATLILRDVLGFSAREVAEALDATTASVNSALARARKTIDRTLPELSQQANARALGDQRLRSTVEAFMDAMERADVDAVVALLTEDATWSMPPFATWYRGRSDIAAFCRAGPFRDRRRFVPTVVNGQPAFAIYVWHPEHEAFIPGVLDVLTLRGERIEAITAFIDPSAFAQARRAEPGVLERLPFPGPATFARFGLPDRPPA